MNVMAEPAISLTMVPLHGPAAPGIAAQCLPGLQGPQQLRALAIQDERQRTEYILCQRALQCVAEAQNPGQACSLLYTPSGKPLLRPGPHVSVSRAGGFAAIGLCHAHEIGIDLAWMNSVQNELEGASYPGLTRRMLSTGRSGKLAFLTAWTELEAICKLRQIPMQQLLAKHEPSPACLATYHVHDLVLGVACETACTVSIGWAEWTGAMTLRKTVAPHDFGGG